MDEAFVGKNMVMKRWRARARGRAAKILKPFSQLTIVLKEKILRKKIMGQKVNPISMRLGINRTWDSTWYAGKNEYSVLLKEDLNMRKMILAI